ncbi:MAG: ABC transporter permease, partial [Gemmatimonadota bacterium]|nr:ABC transporter permease [Gemmatimonadota bacterium]
LWLAACVSVANLTLARTAARRRELAIRAALGGRRARLARHLIVEALGLALIGGALGVAVAAWGVRAIRAAVPEKLANFVPGWNHVAVDARALLFTLLASMGSLLVFALLPATRASRVKLSSVLSDDGRGSAGGVHGTRLRAALVVLEVSVAVVLLSGAALLHRSVRNMTNGDPGVRRENLLSMHLMVPRGTSDSAVVAFYDRVDARVRATPGVVSAALISATPLSNSSWGLLFDIPGRPSPRAGDRLSATDQRTTPEYFRTVGVRLMSGRGIEARDEQSAPRVAVVNQFMAEQLWPKADAVGRNIIIDSISWTIVGVASNVRHGGFDAPLRFEIYRSARQAVSRSTDMVVWTVGEPGPLREPLRLAVAAADPAAAVGDMMTMREMEARHVSPFKLMADLVSIFAAITMVIAIVGLYGVIAYGVAQRTREIGVRLALGAQRGDIVILIARGAARLTLLGIGIGAGGAFAFGKLLGSVLYGVSASDPRTPLGVASALFGVAVVAAVVPAWRASRLNPAVAVRD